jgi:hypothetical protein
MFPHAMADAADDRDVILDHPNRDKASSKAARAVVVLLLLVSAVLLIVIAVGGWDFLQGAKALHIAYILIYLMFAFYVLRWNRGVLPVIAAFAIVLLIFAALAGLAWFDRDKEGFDQPPLDSGVLGLVSWLLVPVQLLLIVFCAQGFAQAWSVEVERRRTDRLDRPSGSPAASSA